MLDARLALALSVLCTLTACKSSDSEKLEGLLDTYAEERTAVRDLLCTCPSALGYATSNECESGIGEIDGMGKQCIVDAFDGQESLGEDYFDCVLPLQDQYRDCLNAALTCGDDWFVPCEDAYDGNVLDTCPTLPTDVAMDYANCLPG